MKKAKIFGICLLILSNLSLTSSSVYACAPGEVYKKVPTSYYDDYYTTPDRIMATNSRTNEYVMLHRGATYKAFSVHGKTKIVTYDATHNRTVVTDNRGNLIEERKLNLQELSNALYETVQKTGDKSFTLDIPNLPKPIHKEAVTPKHKNEVASKNKAKVKPKVQQENKKEIKSENKVEANQNKPETKKEIKENNTVEIKNQDKAENIKEPQNQDKEDIKEVKLEALKETKPTSSTSSSLLIKIGATIISLGILLIGGLILRSKFKSKRK